MDTEFIKALADNLLTVLILGYWVITERQNRQRDVEYYRETIAKTLNECKALLEHLQAPKK